MCRAKAAFAAIFGPSDETNLLHDQRVDTDLPPDQFLELLWNTFFVDEIRKQLEKKERWKSRSVNLLTSFGISVEATKNTLLFSLLICHFFPNTMIVECREPPKHLPPLSALLKDISSVEGDSMAVPSLKQTVRNLQVSVSALLTERKAKLVSFHLWFSWANRILMFTSRFTQTCLCFCVMSSAYICV